MLSQFTGVVLCIEKDKNSLQNYSKNKSFVSLTALIATFSLILVFILNQSSMTFYLMFIFSIIGILISLSILKQENGLKDFIGDTFCSSNTEKKDCNAVLSSKGAYLFGDLKLSDLCLIYFSGFSISLIFFQLQNLGVFSLALVSLFAIPVTLYSIYYQAFVLKKWCALCLSVVVLL